MSGRRRSWLYVPADQPRKVARGAASDADVVILDCEDAVPAHRKAEGRDGAAGALRDEDFGGSLRYVRINAMTTDHWRRDVEATLPHAPDGYVLPKASSPEAVRLVAAAVREAAPPALPRLVPILTEDVAGVFAAAATMTADDLVEDVHWGSEDLSASLGARRVKDDDGELLDVFRLVRSMMLLEAARHGRRAIDTPYLTLRDPDGLRREARRVALMGFAGKQAIHPDHVPVINEAFLPDDDELRAARELVAAFDAGGAIQSLEGEMADNPHLLRARQVLALAGEA